MLEKIIQISKNLLFSLLAIVILGFVIYFLTSYLTGYSFLYAYLGNLLLIIIILVMDERILTYLQSEKFVLIMKKDIKRNYRYIRNLESNVSFKTDLYLFYIIVLIGSEIVNFYPTLVGDDIENFFLINRYNIVLLFAFDSLIEEYFKNKEKMKKISTKLEKSLIENQD
jgi:hypothetical protein